MLSRLLTPREQALLFFTAAAVLAGGIALGAYHRPPEPVEAPPPAAAAPIAPVVQDTAPPAPAPEPEPDPGIGVSVQGAVPAPGLYFFQPQQRVADAIRAAGGASPAAHTAALNPGAHLIDGTTLIVPAWEGGHAFNPAPYLRPAYQATAPEPAAPESGPAYGQYLETSRPVDINRASLGELETLPRIGPALAARIAAQRPYQSVDDLLDVEGIGPKTLEVIRPYVVVE